jgi:hypothetical protein
MVHLDLGFRKESAAASEPFRAKEYEVQLEMSDTSAQKLATMPADVKPVSLNCT